MPFKPHIKILTALLIALLVVILPQKATAQLDWDTSDCSGLQLRTSVYCPTEDNFIQMWTGIYLLTPGVPTIVTSISDSDGNTYSPNDIITPTEDIEITIHSTLNGNNCTDIVKVTVAKLPEASIIDGAPEPILCINTYIDEPKVDTQNVDIFTWEKYAMPPQKISFPFQVTEDMTIRLVCANSACGDYSLIINIPLKVVDTAPLPGLHITQPYRRATPSSNSNFSYITDVCQGCAFPLPGAEDIKVDSGIIQSASISWFLPDIAAFRDTTRYGFATITLRGDSNICGYKSKTFIDQLVQVDIKTYSCKPIIYFGSSSLDTVICPCGTYNFGVTKPGGNAGKRCIYTEDSIVKRVTPEPSPLNNPSLGSYNFKVVDSFQAYVSVTAQQQCPAGAPKSTVPVTVKDSINITIDDRKCPFIVDYYYCPNDTGYISFTRTLKEGEWEKEVLYVDFFPPHGDTSIKRDTFIINFNGDTITKRDTFTIDSLRTDYHTVYYKTRGIIQESLKPFYSNTHFYDTVRYRVTYRRNICGDTAFYDTFATFRLGDYCEPKISVQASDCAGDKIYINVREVSRAAVIDSVVIKDSAEFYVLKLDKDTVITSYSLFDSTWDYDISQHIQHTVKAYTKSKQNQAILNIPITVYWRDTLDPYWHDSIKKTEAKQLINYTITPYMTAWICKDIHQGV